MRCAVVAVDRYVARNLEAQTLILTLNYGHKTENKICLQFKTSERNKTQLCGEERVRKFILLRVIERINEQGRNVRCPRRLRREDGFLLKITLFREEREILTRDPVSSNRG